MMRCMSTPSFSLYVRLGPLSRSCLEAVGMAVLLTGVRLAVLPFLLAGVDEEPLNGLFRCLREALGE